MAARGIDIWSDIAVGPDLRILDGIASWCGGLHGSMELAAALTALSTGFGASAAAISRHHRKEYRGRLVAVSDRNTDSEVPDLRRAFAEVVIGNFYSHSEVGSAWFLNERIEDPDWSGDEVLDNWMFVRDVKDVVVFVLSSTQQHRDFIEFHFDHVLTRGEVNEIESVVPTITRSWAGRQPGLVTNSQMDVRLLNARAKANEEKLDWNAPILGMSNPAGLGRAEFRVCLLLSRGLSVKGVTDELGLTEATVRSHLRSIYSKTETSGQAELLYRILSSDAEMDELQRVNTI